MIDFLSGGLRDGMRIGAVRIDTHPREPMPVTYGITRFSAFQQVLHIAGWVAGGRITTLTLRLPSGGGHPLDIQPGGGGRVVFGQTVHIAHPDEQIAAATLEVGHAGAETVTLTNLGAPPAEPVHTLFPRFLDTIRARPSGHLLEVGSRARSGITRREAVPESWRYTGLDVMAGPNVDVTGDAHRLSKIFAAEKFDAVMSFAVLEHLMMPWKFVIELNRVLNPGAIGLFITHQTWPVHEMPWDFWRFSDAAWASLLNPATGFEIIDAQMGEQAYCVPKFLHTGTDFRETWTGSLISGVLFRKVSDTSLDWPVEIEDITGTFYPPPPT